MRRMEEANFRQVWRVMNLLLRMKRHKRQTEALENSAACHYLSETKWVSNG
jgi:hypothetical protein